MFKVKLQNTQENLVNLGLDGWLLYDFRRSNDLACQFLEFPPERLVTRRFFYWIPTSGEPVKLVQAIESKILDFLPGKLETYRTWHELIQKLCDLLYGAKQVAMEYSEKGALPYVSKVDAGTIEMVRSLGVKVVSSANLLLSSSKWDEGQLSSHLQAAEALDMTAEETWDFIKDSLLSGKQITEYDVQQFILERFAVRGCVSNDPPIAAINANTANPHYIPEKDTSLAIHKGDFILIDLWCRKKEEGSVYADITRVGIAAANPSRRQNEIFSIVKQAQEAATALVRERMFQQKPLLGWEVDQAARDVIETAGFGEFFIHRTGHNIDILDHGPGTHMDNFETHDDRLVLPQTCFSIEPGIYLPGEFGIRLEYDLYIHQDRKVEITGGIQTQIKTLF